MHSGKHFSMIRDFHLADWFTLGNASCGVGALFAVMHYVQHQNMQTLLLACGLILLAFVFDVFDGRVARWRQQTSLLGRELDSLADVISFGVAPAIIAYGIGMDGFWDHVILIYFVACGVSRLARYNISAETLSQGGAKVRYFEGTPIPSSLLLVIVIALAAWNGAVGDQLWFGVIPIGPWQLHPLVLMFAASGSLMISRTLHIPKL
ncbi:MAG TPA: CDP-diacylglycerol--serine O-phosphatidyltransferase [Thiobacillus sp.]|nr:MAG: CDP-diacylglycerol--serine O-phosphatidyltransferase [Hydrogenophilales bacterium 28-61-11]OYZ58740.1 MAG: CDP-diacylglycerol--serine O-phosphatidyltransferase [Hydrogenophilales bacterium 16-61-112]OZA45127.1 MAG: CDP-diacylglycerol--serine O-phosphatidyltransferase [Hydrogenophilales bacterium 17-61-76]HQT31880.1 CDP-diacylglycerol--serine O-phosphatidyltransferase [Thiobacillus sp.]HQT70539.1 CDP-diacylglycerol--serine O-phosphatidyltransferase [Thiobacillus sp.]